ncbi:MAG TPA: hypothetical protein VG722_09775 [Tepidisphaeraceae bacterium]|nr:hypothetical protein [Tepidisphaeraceae bacterium]
MAKGKNAALFEVMDRGTAMTAGHAGTNLGPQSQPIQSPLTMRIDRDRQLLHFSISTVTAIIVAFAVVVLIVISFLIGKHVGERSQQAVAVSTEELLKSPPDPQVMQVQPGVNGPPAQNPADQNQQTPPENTQRQAGLNYVIMQSYPADMHASAVEAQTALLRHSVPCTIEPSPSRLGVPKGWISVVGTTGFKSISTEEFKTYVHGIEAANNELHGKFKKLTPIAYKW